MESSKNTTHNAAGSPFIRTWVKAIRLHQWIKNALIFMPAVLAHKLLQPDTLNASVLAFLAFGCCASSVYLINDLFDIRADRAHPRKRFRPLASGAITPRAAVIAAILLLLASIGFTLAVNVKFAVILGCYYVTTWAYSLRLKRVALLDVMVLAALYTIRIIAGAVATEIELSFWLLAFSVFIFLSLALIKRYAELVANLGVEYTSGSHRPYVSEDMPVVLAFGIAAGYASIVVIALYINSPESQAIYHHHKPLWLICPVMLYWISRTWMLASRGRMRDDPVVFAARDPISLIILALLAVIVLSSI